MKKHYISFQLTEDESVKHLKKWTGLHLSVAENWEFPFIRIHFVDRICDDKIYEIGGGLIITESTSPKEILEATSKLLDCVKIEKTIIALFSKIFVFARRQDPHLPSLENPVTIKILHVYKGSYLDYENIDFLERVNWREFVPEVTDDFELLFHFQISIKNNPLVSENFFYTMTTKKRVKKNYQAYFDKHPNSKIVYTYKFDTLKEYDTLKAQRILDFYFEQIQAGSCFNRSALIYNVIHHFDYTNREIFIRNKMDLSIFAPEALQLKTEGEIEFDLYNKDWKLIERYY